MDLKLLSKYIKILALTAVLFVAGLYFADRLVTPVGELEEFYDEPKNTVDVLIVGSSHTMCSVCPTVIYENTGLTAYNLSTWSQPVWVSYHYIKEALKYQSPQVIILDTFGAFYDRSYLTGVDIDLVSDDYARLMKPSLNLLMLNFTRRRVQVSKKPIEEYFNIAKYHSRITELTGADLTKMFIDNSTAAKGYGPFYTMESFGGYEYPATDRQAELYPYAAVYLDKIISLCNEKNIKLVLIKTPHIADENDVALINTIRRIAEINGLDFLDYCSYDALGLDFETDFADHGHLNNYGAKKQSAVVAEYLASLSLSANHSRQTEERWAAALQSENEETARMEIRLAKSFKELITKVKEHGTTTLILAKQDGGVLTGRDYADIYELFANTPFEMDLAQIKENDLFIYTDGQVLTGRQADKWCKDKEIDIILPGVDGAGAGGVQIIKDGGNYSFGRDGLNAVMYSDKTEEIYHYISFAKEHGYMPYTK